VTEPEGAVVRLTLDRLAPEPVVHCTGWCSGEEAALTLPQPDGGNEILIVPVAQLVAHLAALVGLGPRPDGSRQQQPEKPRLHWRIEATWHGPGGTLAGRVVAALDGGDAGWWLIPDDGGDARPTTATELFRRLCALLPVDAELG
jgi:hypothetical protein